MDDIRTIKKDGKVYAKCFRADCGVRNDMVFLTEDADPLQIGIFERGEGYKVGAHRHKGRKLDLPDVGEFLWIQSGSAKVEVFDEEWKPLGEWTVQTGDCMIMLRGGHALTMLEKTRILEVKQGPYPGKDSDKHFRDPR